MTDEAKKMYEDALNEFIKARKELAEATIKYDAGRHSLRVDLYEEKMSGTKYTEEQIRSITIHECAELKRTYELALANYEITKETLEFVKATCNKVMF